MMLMMVAAGALAIGMPYLMVSLPVSSPLSLVGKATILNPISQKNLDPEALKELEGNQAKLAGVQNAFAAGNLKDGYVARCSIIHV